MKIRTRAIIALFLCTIMLLSTALPVFAKRPIDYIAHDYEMYYNFMQQSENGISNATAFEDAYAAFDETYPGFLDGYEITSIISPVFYSAVAANCLYYIQYANFFATVFISFDDGEMCGDGEMELYPDFCGDFDISGTMTEGVYSPEAGATHIRSVNVNNCAALRDLKFNGQLYCTNVSALNCISLSTIELLNGVFTNIKVQPNGYDKAVEMVSVGGGAIGFEYKSDDATLYAYPNGDGFDGWYVNGVCLSTEITFNYDGDGRIYACFAGDVNNDGSINMVDANLIMRQALDPSPDINVEEYDLDANGAISVSDALIAIRIGMGL